MDLIAVAPVLLVWGTILAVIAHDLRGSVLRRVAFVVVYSVTGIVAVGLLLALLRRLSFDRNPREAIALGRLPDRA